MESRRMSTRSSRRSSLLPVSPIKQAVMANVMQGVGKATVKRSSRKVLADKTNAATVAKLVPGKSPKKAPAEAAAAAPIKAEAEVASPCFVLQSFEPQVATPVAVQGEDLLRSLVHSNLTIIQTPNGPVRQSPEAETPQFGVPADLLPAEDSMKEAEEVVAGVEVSTPLSREFEGVRTPVEVSPSREVTASVSERLSFAWVGCDVDEVPEIAEDDDSNWSVKVNVISPGMQLVSSPAPATAIHPTTPRAADFKWQPRDQLTLKVKEQESENCSYYGGDEEYEGCDEFDGAEDYDGEVIDCEEICQAISRMVVAEGGLPEHKGRHIRFNYNSDDEIEVEEVDVMRLRGVPTPRGKHLRFPEEQEVQTP